MSASTQNQALGAVLFLYQVVLALHVPELQLLVRARRPVRLPCVLAREEVLNAYLFHSTAEAQALTDAWLVDYNEHRPQ